MSIFARNLMRRVLFPNKIALGDAADAGNFKFDQPPRSGNRLEFQCAFPMMAAGRVAFPAERNMFISFGINQRRVFRQIIIQLNGMRV